MSLSLSPARFNILPNEILEHICSFVSVYFVFPGERWNIYAVLARTSQRLRRFALPFYFSTLKVNSSNVQILAKL